MSVIEMAKKAKEASLILQSLPEEIRVQALKKIAEKILLYKEKLLHENQLDLKSAEKAGLSSAMKERLILTSQGVEALASMCLEVAAGPQVVGVITEEYQTIRGLVVQKQRIPIGVIGMIFESRPNVVVDGAALAIKSANAIILKGGKEAQMTNRLLFEIISAATENILPPGSVSLVENRADVQELLNLREYIDLMVPRGGSELIKFIRAHATMPVVAHDRGLCHLYVHQSARKSLVIPIILNSKVQKPSACNALETLLLHENYLENKEIITTLLDHQVEVRGCEKTLKLDSRVKLAQLKDYETEYLDKIISVKIVSSLEEAISHIQKHSSHHTEVILSEDKSAQEKFLNSLDASVLLVNTSTRFNDGGELGLGAELGISTSKLHAYGPMGAREMTTTRFLVRGEGQIR